MAKAKTTRTKATKTKATKAKTAASKSKTTSQKSTKKKSATRQTKAAPKKATPKTKKAPAKSKKASAKKEEELNVGDLEVQMDRRRDDRRDDVSANSDEAVAKAPERRQKVNRRRQIDPTTCERDYNAEEKEFMDAVDEYKRAAGRMFPTCSEILEVVRALGYKRLTPEELAILNPVAPAESSQEEAEGVAIDPTTDTPSPEPVATAPVMSYAVREEYGDPGNDDSDDVETF